MSRLPPSQNGSNLSPKLSAGAVSSGPGNSPLGSPRANKGLNAPSLHLPPGHLSPYRDPATRFSNTHGASSNLAVGSSRSSALARDAASSLSYPTSASRPTSPSPEQQLQEQEQKEEQQNDTSMTDDSKTSYQGVATRTRRKAKQEAQQEVADVKLDTKSDSEDALNAAKGGKCAL
jgi:hypothetical protein